MPADQPGAWAPAPAPVAAPAPAADPAWLAPPSEPRGTATSRPEDYSAPRSLQPNWAPTPAAAADSPGTVSWSSTAAIGAAGTLPAPRTAGEAAASVGALAALTPGLVPLSSVAAAPAARDADGEHDEPDAYPRRHPYTWLHFLALALVAFVLGFLIVLLWSRSGAFHADGGATPPAVAVATLEPFGSASDPA